MRITLLTACRSDEIFIDHMFMRIHQIETNYAFHALKSNERKPKQVWSPRQPTKTMIIIAVQTTNH